MTGIIQAFLIALDMLLAHKLRAVLTILGVIIGVMSVTIIFMLSEGFQLYLKTQFLRLGADTIFLFYDPGRRMRGQTTGGIEDLRMSDLDYIRNRSQLIEIASAYNEIGGRTVRYGEQEMSNPRIQAVDEHFPTLNRLKVIEGRHLTEKDIKERNNVCVIGVEIRSRLFGSESPIGKKILLPGITLEVVGVLEEIEFMGEGTGRALLIPITTVQDKWLGGDDLMLILMRPKPGVTVEQAMDEVWQIMMRKSGNRPIYRLDSRGSILQTFGAIIRVAGIILGAIAALSLLVGGIGIMNIMLVSVTERTREIGLRKAVGATRTAILMQFLVESATLSLAGGMIGMGLGWLIGYAGSTATKAMGIMGGTGFMVSFPVWAALFALAFSASVGIVFGMYPAMRAASLDPIVALRAE
ncbi:MAG TPA: ABC transporter permease [Fimbriimonadales bacterium]|nr:ABC transporter permease [Fimbriimonadales bacterium]